MLYIGIPVGLILLAIMIYMALRKESDFRTRIACLIALAVMIISLIVCLFIIFVGGKAPVDESVLIVAQPVKQEPKGKSSFFIALLFTAFLMGLFIVILIMSMREHRNNNTPAEKPAQKKARPKAG